MTEPNKCDGRSHWAVPDLTWLQPSTSQNRGLYWISQCVCVCACGMCVSYFTTLCIRMKLGFVVGGGQCMSPVVSLGVDWERYMTGFVSWCGPDWSLHLQPPSDNLQHISKWQQLGWHGDSLAWIHRATSWEKHKREWEKGQRETRAWKIRERERQWVCVFKSHDLSKSTFWGNKKTCVLFGKKLHQCCSYITMLNIITEWEVKGG